jgi:hypothetical protein
MWRVREWCGGIANTLNINFLDTLQSKHGRRALNSEDSELEIIVF